MDADTGAERRGTGVVVGIDGTSLALHAVRWAAAEARLRGVPLHILHAAPYAAGPARSARRRAHDILARAFTVARRAEPDVEVTTGQTEEAPARSLLDAATTARLLVVGMGGGDRPQEVRIGSTALDVSGRASCPVVVVRGHHHSPGVERPVLVGIDTVETDSVALTLAFSDARRHGGRLVVLHARHGAGPLREHLAREDETARVTARNSLHDELTPWTDRFPDVPVELKVVQGNPARALVSAAEDARMLVLGTRGHGAYARALFGSTSREVLRRCPAPVLVVNPETVVADEEDGPVAIPAAADRRTALDDPHDLSRLW